MATFLQLCEKLARESGAIGTAPSSVTGQTGRQEKAVNWIADAWTDIQRGRADWLFLRAEFEGTLALNTMRYTGASLNITDHAEWLLTNPVSIYPEGEQNKEKELSFVPFERWRRSYNFGTHEPGEPVVWSIGYDGQLCVGPKPDQAYKIRGEYIRKPQTLAANGDVPLMPERFHDAIVHKATMLLCEHDEAWPAREAAEKKLTAIRMDMLRDLTDEVTTGGNRIG